jgi:acyl-CoA thioester hydrolase
MPPFQQIPVEKITQLPVLHRTTIGDEHLDAMGHMNVRHYLGIFDDAGWKFFESFGMTMDYYQDHTAGAFALAQHIRYLAEVRKGETVVIHGRIVARSERRVHFIYFMVNETTGKLAATMEGMGSHADLTTRRTSPYPPEIAEKIDVLVAEHDQLDWDAPLSGAMRA